MKRLVIYGHFNEKYTVTGYIPIENPVRENG